MQCTIFDGHTFQLLKFIVVHLPYSYSRGQSYNSFQHCAFPENIDTFPIEGTFSKSLREHSTPSKFQSLLWRVWIFSGAAIYHFRDSLKTSSSHWEKRNSSHKKHNRMVVTFFRAVVSHLDMGLKTKERRSRSGNQSCSSFVTHNSTSFSVFFRIAFCQISLICG